MGKTLATIGRERAMLRAALKKLVREATGASAMLAIFHEDRDSDEASAGKHPCDPVDKAIEQARRVLAQT